jgi:serine/threonine protein kinase
LIDLVQSRDIDFTPIWNDNARDCLRRMLDRNPKTRIDIYALIKMNWVTNSGTEPLQVSSVKYQSGKDLAYAEPNRLKPIATIQKPREKLMYTILSNSDDAVGENS